MTQFGRRKDGRFYVKDNYRRKLQQRAKLEKAMKTLVQNRFAYEKGHLLTFDTLKRNRSGYKDYTMGEYSKAFPERVKKTNYFLKLGYQWFVTTSNGEIWGSKDSIISDNSDFVRIE